MRSRLIAIVLAAAAVPLALGLAAAPARAQRADPVPRFEDPLCPGVTGLRVDMAELVVGRIRQNAEALGRWMAPPELCEPNVIISFVPSGRQAVRQLYRDQPWEFVEMRPSDRDALLADAGPVHVFSRVFTRTHDGMMVPRRDSLTDLPEANAWAAHSKIYAATRQDIVRALVFFDAAAVRGMSVNQLADYATMRALVHAPPSPAQTGGNSILNLFDAPPGARPAGLTAYDRALLASLYEGLPNINGTAREASMAHATALAAGGK